ncbi:unnamed protein product [Cylicocyclus nassatus]|uniref:Uncharacterized protein n=1 Tax=Cylicocyclus nassatus TaxID=53992 RepID=A0AA36H1V2_CYLNA|nr:unnamed protein product [Cylicocyclus nassatus]
MWSPAGPSWLVEHQPPLKTAEWPRATTPVNARNTDSFLLGTSADSGVYMNLTFSSPPIINKPDQNRISPGLRTPTSRPGIHMSTTPSPFRTFRLTSFGSPTFSDRALRLSNSENVVGFRFRGGSIEKPKRIIGMSPRVEATENSVSRCLQMPSTSDSTNLDQTLPMTMGDFYDSHLEAMADDSGLFCNDLSIQATSTPLRTSSQACLFPATNVAPVPNPYADLCLENPAETPILATSPVVLKSSPPTPTSFKRAMRDVQRQGTLQPRKLLTESTNIVNNCPNENVERKATAELKKRPESCDLFEPPKKPLKPYSRRWMRLATGGTQIQKELTAAAHAFIAGTPRYSDSW